MPEKNLGRSSELNKHALMDHALAQLMGDMDELEGHEASRHSLEDCPDPLNCTMHDEEHGDSISALGEPAHDGGKTDGHHLVGVEIKVHPAEAASGLPSLQGAHAKEDGKHEAMEQAADELRPEEAEELRKLFR